MSEPFEQMLAGGHPNSLGRTEEVVDLILADSSRLAELYDCYSSPDEVVRLRVSSAFKRVTKCHPDWTMAYPDRFQGQIAGLDQASAQWTLALLFDLTKDLQSPRQRERSVEIMQRNMAENSDWIVLNNSMQVLFEWSADEPELAAWLRPQLERLTQDSRKSVAKRATKLLSAPRHTL